jgi:hypothetical protein
MNDYIKFENEILEKLKTSGLIKRFSFSEVLPNPNLAAIKKIFENPVLIDCDDEGIFYIDENGDKIYCPSMAFSLSESGEWLSDLLPPITFDIEQSGNVRKADEAEALLCVCFISLILKEDLFREEVLTIAREYDFSEMKPNNSSLGTFRELLNSWQDLQSVVINIIVSATKFKISFFKKDIEKFLRDGISEEEVAELRDLNAKLRGINFKYSEGPLSRVEVKKLTKIERLHVIDERDVEINKCITESNVGTLYKLLHLSSEYIKVVDKRKIEIWVKKEVDTLLEKNSGYSDIIGERLQIISKLQRRALRFQKNSIRRLNVEKYVEDRENFKFPSKK